jgi:hypothetical protein
MRKGEIKVGSIVRLNQRCYSPFRRFYYPLGIVKRIRKRKGKYEYWAKWNDNGGRFQFSYRDEIRLATEKEIEDLLIEMI